MTELGSCKSKLYCWANVDLNVGGRSVSPETSYNVKDKNWSVQDHCRNIFVLRSFFHTLKIKLSLTSSSKKMGRFIPIATQWDTKSVPLLDARKARVYLQFGWLSCVAHNIYIYIYIFYNNDKYTIYTYIIIYII